MNIKDTYKQASQLVAFKSVREGKYVVCQVNHIIEIEKIKGTNNCRVFYVNALGEGLHVETRMTISDLNDILPNTFILCNRNSIVNSLFISEYDDTTLWYISPYGKHSVPLTCWGGARIVEIEK